MGDDEKKGSISVIPDIGIVPSPPPPIDSRDDDKVPATLPYQPIPSPTALSATASASASAAVVAGDSKRTETGVTIEAPNHGAIFSLNKYEGPNPFRPRTSHRTCYNRTKMVIMTVCMIPLIRMILLIIIFLFITLFATFATCCHTSRRRRASVIPPTPRTAAHAPRESKGEEILGHGINDHKDDDFWEDIPLSSTRRFLFIWPIRFLCRAILFVLGFYWIRSTDRRKHPTGAGQAKVIVSNHVSLWDPAWIIWHTGCSAAAKSDVFKIPVLGRVFRALQFLPIYRESAHGRKRSLREIMRRATTTAFPQFLIFPEGTTSNDQFLTMFKRGPFAAGVPVSPVCLSYSANKHMDLFHGPSMAWDVYLTLCQFVNYASFDFLEEYIPNEAEKKDSQLFANNVRAVMARHMGVKTTEHSYADVVLLSAAHRAHVNMDVTADEVHKFAHMDLDATRKLLKRFHELDKDGDGVIRFEEFCQAIGVEQQKSTAQRLFALLDTDHDGNIAFSEFIVATAVFAGQCSILDSCKVLFEICDLDADNKVGRDELNKVLQMAEDPEELTNGALLPTTPKDLRSDVVSAELTASRANAELIKSTLFPANEAFVTFEQFVERLTPHPEVATGLLTLFLWKRVGESHASLAAATRKR